MDGEVARRAQQILAEACLLPIDVSRVIQEKMKGPRAQVLLEGAVRSPLRRPLVLKCFETSEHRETARVDKELRRAQNASRAGLGAPVFCAIRRGSLALLATDKGVGDLEGFLRARNWLPLHLLQQLLRQAFDLCAHPWMVEHGLVCCDLKPSNFVVYLGRSPTFSRPLKSLASLAKHGRLFASLPLTLRLVDFDPYLWSRGASSECGILNKLMLLLNLLSWKTKDALGPYLPEGAKGLAVALRDRSPDLISLLETRLGCLEKGPLHYFRLDPTKEHISLETLLKIVDTHMSYHKI
jgi:hypothetical protein